MSALRFAILIPAALFGFGAVHAQPAGRPVTPDLKEIRDYRLNMDAVQRYVKTFTALNADAGSKKCMEADAGSSAGSLDAAEKQLNACAAAVTIIKGNGLKPREFIILTGALIGDMMAVSLKKSGTIKDYPNSISPENATFVEQNFDKLQALLAPMTGGGGRR